MSKSLNSVSLIGNVGADPEVRSTTGGNRVATLSLATSESWKDRAGVKQEKTQWHRLVVWDTLADVVEKYVSKGDKLYVQGKIEYRQWEDNEGNKRYSTEIRVMNLIMLGGKNGSRDMDGPPADRASSKPQRAAPAKAAKQQDMDFEDFPNALADEDDDLPF
jgi:single-strand DNA-binding protein